MPPGKPLRPQLQKKVDELFLRWLSDPDTQRALSDGLQRIRDATPDPATFDPVTPDPAIPHTPTPDPSTPDPATHNTACALPLGAPARPRRTTGYRAVSDCAGKPGRGPDARSLEVGVGSTSRQGCVVRAGSRPGHGTVVGVTPQSVLTGQCKGRVGVKGRATLLRSESGVRGPVGGQR